MDTAREDGAQHDPEESRPPTILGGQGRADERSRAGDGREVMPEDDPLVGRNIIPSVVAGHGRGDVAVVEHQHLRADPRPIVPIGESKYA